jgi:hypothetical protein
MATMTAERTDGERLWARHIALLKRAQERGDQAAEAILRSQSNSIAEKAREMDAADEIAEMRRLATQ